MTNEIKRAIFAQWPRPPEPKPQIPTRPLRSQPTDQELRSWHYSQGPRPGTEYPKLS